MKLKSVSCLLASLALGLSASGQAVGSWQSVPAYGGTPAKVIDSGRKVMAVSQNKLMAFDRDSEELLGYSTENYLTDNKIDNIYYNFDRRFAVVVYKNCNTDLSTTMAIPQHAGIARCSLGCRQAGKGCIVLRSRIYVAGEFRIYVYRREYCVGFGVGDRYSAHGRIRAR